MDCEVDAADIPRRLLVKTYAMRCIWTSECIVVGAATVPLEKIIGEKTSSRIAVVEIMHLILGIRRERVIERGTDKGKWHTRRGNT